jgi:hypothetical protein
MFYFITPPLQKSQENWVGLSHFWSSALSITHILYTDRRMRAWRELSAEPFFIRIQEFYGRFYRAQEVLEGRCPERDSSWEYPRAKSITL